VSATEAERAEDQFFHALLAGDVERTEALLAHDVLIVDVIGGGVVRRVCPGKAQTRYVASVAPLSHGSVTVRGA
jgi:hypothetical protein